MVYIQSFEAEGSHITDVLSGLETYISDPQYGGDFLLVSFSCADRHICSEAPQTVDLSPVNTPRPKFTDCRNDTILTSLSFFLRYIGTILRTTAHNLCGYNFTNNAHRIFQEMASPAVFTCGEAGTSAGRMPHGTLSLSATAFVA